MRDGPRSPAEWLLYFSVRATAEPLQVRSAWWSADDNAIGMTEPIVTLHVQRSALDLHEHDL